MGYRPKLVVRRNNATGIHKAAFASDLPLKEWEHIESWSCSKWGYSKTSIFEAEKLANDLNAKAGLPVEYNLNPPRHLVPSNNEIRSESELEKYKAIMLERAGRAVEANQCQR